MNESYENTAAEREPGITRRQAWMKLAVAIADGLPEPIQIDFFDATSVSIKLDSAESFGAWAEHLGASTHPRHPSTNDRRWIYTATGHWFGWYVSLTAYPPRIPDIAPIDEDLTAVRALAEQDANGDAMRDGALITAAQSGQVIVGPYATQEIIAQLVEQGLGEYITDQGRGTVVRGAVIGFAINGAGRDEAHRLRAAEQDADAPTGSGLAT